MAGMRDIAIRWYRQAFGAPAGSDIRDEGHETVLQGNDAVALSEAAIASHVVDNAEGPRGVIAAATGLAMVGRRATAFLSGSDIAAAQDLLISASGKHAPLVLHLAARAATAHGRASGSGHDTFHQCSDSGWFTLFAENVQQAVDFTFIARRVAEETLVPGLVVMDGGQTALAPQDVRLLSPNQASTFLGSAADWVDAPTAAQRLLFGETRRRLPAWHDLDEPMLTGAVYDNHSFALGTAARRPFFDDFVGEALGRAFENFEKKTGRSHDTVSRYRLDSARVVLVAQGSAIETARVAADQLRKKHKLRVGVLGIHALRPSPGAEIAAALAGAEKVFVLERVDAPLSSEPPLTREIRAALHHADNKLQLQSAVYGVGGLPLRFGDIAELCTGKQSNSDGPLFLGIAFDESEEGQPKREVLLDALRRAYPDAAALGIRTPLGQSSPAEQDALAIAIRRRVGGERLLGATGAVLHSLDGGRVRSRRSARPSDLTGTQVDWLVHGDEKLLDPGGDFTADVTLDAGRRTVTLERDDTVLRIPDDDDDELAAEMLLGGLFGALIKDGRLDARVRRIASARRAMLPDRDAVRLDELVAAFQAGIENLAEDEAHASQSGGSRRDESAPASVRELGRNDDHVASLPRFWDQAGVLYRDGTADRLTADPYFATGSMPPLSSTLRNLSAAYPYLPSFDPSACTGCGKCWTQCPDSAIGVVAASPAALIDAGIARTGAEAVRQVAPKLASRMIAANKKAESPPTAFGEMLQDAFEWLMEKAPLPDDRKAAIKDGVEKIVTEMGALPVAVTKPFFHDAEAQKKDSADLLSIAVNADACKDCGICISACEPGALQAQARDATVLEGARELWQTWSSTPDTTSVSLERAAEHPDVGPTAAMLLSRYCQFAMAGGDPAEPGCGEKLALKLALATTEFHQQPIVQRYAKSLEDAGSDLISLIRDTLAGTLPVSDLDVVSEQLESVASPRVDLATLAERIAADDRDHTIETDYLLSLIELSKQITAAHHELVEGTHGLGRSRYGLAITGETTTAWAASFPSNPFQVPVLVDMSGDAAQIAAGLIEGHLAETTELVRLQRRARLEIDRPDGLDWKREELAKLGWQDLTDEELELCPPLLLAGSDEMLTGRGLAQLIGLLNSGLPLKVLVLSSLDLGLAGAQATGARPGTGLLALSQRDAFVAQTSLADATHFGESLHQALKYRGPALVQVYTPSPSRDGFDTACTVEQAGLAVEARVLPLFRYDPRKDGVFGTRISLEGNPDAGDEAPTPTDWAGGQARFAPHLGTDALTRAADRCMDDWRTLQELAGVVTPFTEQLEAELRDELAAEHQAELDAQKKAADAELAEVREKTQADVAQKLRSRLLELARRRRG